MSELRKGKKQRWVDLLSTTDASLVESPDILGIVADFLLPIVHLFNRTADGIDVLDDGSTCAHLFNRTADGIDVLDDGTPPLTEVSGRWLISRSGEAISAIEEPEFSILVHKSLEKHLPFGVFVAIVAQLDPQKSQSYQAIRMFSDQEISFCTNAERHIVRPGKNEPPWPDKTIVTVKMTPSSVTFLINDKHLDTVALPPSKTTWWPTVGIHNTCSNSFSFV